MSELKINGIGVVVDDKVFKKESDDHIHDIVSNLEDLGVPLVKFDRIPPKRFHKSFAEISFILLDWKLLMMDKPTEEQKKRQYDRNIEFIKSLKEFTFAPIFIFSSEAKEDIIERLVPEEIFDDKADFKNHIFVEKKSDLIDKNSLKVKILNWIEEHPSVYLLKSWEETFSKAKNVTFWDLFERSPSWPKILWNSFEQDLVEESSNLKEILFKQIKSRSEPLVLDKEKIQKDEYEFEVDDIKSVISGTMYLRNELIVDPSMAPGDIFKTGGHYYLNLRPECDSIRGRCDGELYLIKGDKLSSGQVKDFLDKNFHDKFGLLESDRDCVLFGLEGKDFVKFQFNSIIIMKTDDIVVNRICRLLPPYINNIQQRFVSYMGRIGLPRFPSEIAMSFKET